MYLSEHEKQEVMKFKGSHIELDCLPPVLQIPYMAHYLVQRGVMQFYPFDIQVLFNVSCRRTPKSDDSEFLLLPNHSILN